MLQSFGRAAEFTGPLFLSKLLEAVIGEVVL